MTRQKWRGEEDEANGIIVRTGISSNGIWYTVSGCHGENLGGCHGEGLGEQGERQNKHRRIKEYTTHLGRKNMSRTESQVSRTEERHPVQESM